jgi:hypothetical protein
LVTGCSSRQLKQQPRRRPLRLLLPRRRQPRNGPTFPAERPRLALAGRFAPWLWRKMRSSGGGELVAHRCAGHGGNRRMQRRRRVEAEQPAGGGGVTLVRFGLWVFDVPCEPKLRVTNRVGPQFCLRERWRSIVCLRERVLR